MTRQALIIGATGAFGSHAAAALIKHGWSVRALARDPDAARVRAPAMPIDWVKGDAMDPPSVLAAAAGAQLIVHAVNPPGYRNWAGTVLPMIEATIAAAKANGARILVPGNVYNFAPDAGGAIAEDATQAPVTRKGAIRVEMERRLRAASEEGVRVLMLRAGDFFGAGGANSALDWLVLKRKGRAAAMFRPGPGKVRRAFAYLPDLAETAARLLDREADLGAFEVFHFAGHFISLDELVAAVRRASGRPGLPTLPFPWALMGLMSPWDETLRELMEMRYLWRSPIGLSNARLTSFLGDEPQTPLITALRESLGVDEAQAAAAEPRRSHHSANARFGTQQRKLIAR
jgi:nucleoside-diphosphate-sugar epimerase